MSDMACTYHGRREEMLVDYLYDELDAAARPAFEAHLASCEACRMEMTEFRAVRGELAGWAPPEPRRVLAFAPPAAAPRRNVVWSAFADVPAWAQVAAAVLVLGVAAGIANLRISYDARGVTVSTGWMSTPGILTPASAGADGPAAARPAAGEPDAAWRLELAALERDLRAEMEKANPAQSAPARAEVVTLARVRTMIEASERSQRRELALRVAEMAREVQLQRVADLQRIQRSFTVLENTTGGAIVRQGRLLDNLAVRVSQQR